MFFAYSKDTLSHFDIETVVSVTNDGTRLTLTDRVAPAPLSDQDTRRLSDHVLMLSVKTNLNLRAVSRSRTLASAVFS